jgi:hypothetical protein
LFVLSDPFVILFLTAVNSLSACNCFCAGKWYVISVLQVQTY